MPVLQDLLSWADNKRRVMGRNLSDLVSDPSGTIPRLAEDAGRTITQHFQDPMNFVGGGVGHIAYHASPHKFDKFSMDKIGTGEGAQAYGHGLYLAESEAVSGRGGIYDKKFSQSQVPVAQLQRLRDSAPQGSAEWTHYDDLMKNGLQSHIYKTDIPDEAVARFLDWDKPLSQQAEAMSVFRNAGVDVDKEMLSNLGEIIKKQKGLPYNSSPPDIQGILGRLVKKVGSKDAANEYLVQNGIPGIRYLDGGSRSAGQGSSNFVTFDPEMIRILERNGQPTGLKPWNPGEYRPMSDLMTPRTD